MYGIYTYNNTRSAFFMLSFIPLLLLIYTHCNTWSYTVTTQYGRHTYITLSLSIIQGHNTYIHMTHAITHTTSLQDDIFVCTNTTIKDKKIKKNGRKEAGRSHSNTATEWTFDVIAYRRLVRGDRRPQPQDAIRHDA